MKKALKIIFLVVGVIIAVNVILHFLLIKGVVPINTFPDARTLYTGYVEIESVSLSDIKTKLKEQGCHNNVGDEFVIGRCIYHEKKSDLEIYPNGMGWGPLSFTITENMIWAQKDIPGRPTPELFKIAVRQDVITIGNIIKIKEDSWKITEMKYPWDASY